MDSESLVEYLKRYAGSDGRWNSIELTSGDDAEYFTIYNMPYPGEFYVPGRTIVFQMEPMRLGMPGAYGVKSWGEWASPDRSRFLAVRSHQYCHNNAEWHVDRGYNELKRHDYSGTKTKLMSAVLSDKQQDIGHRLRTRFLRYVEDSSPGFVDIHGRCASLGFRGYKGELPEHDKSDAMIPYRYTLAVENNAEKNYFTEKIVDAIVTETLAFYWGCPNLEEHFPDAFIRLPLEDGDFAGCLATVKRSIDANLYDQFLPSIREAKRKVLDEYQYFPTIERIITAHSRL